MMAKEFCRNRTFKTKPIDHLPWEYSFADGSQSLVVDYATTDQLDQCRKMIEEAALRGDNVGVDEYGVDGESIVMLFNSSEIFQASEPISGSIMAFMLITPCVYQRSHDSCTASVYVFRTKDISDEVYAELMNLVAGFAIDIDIGYTQCFTQVALCFQDLYLQLRRKGFLTVAVLPNWVNIARAGPTYNAVMAKDSGLPERPVRSQEEVLKMKDSLLSNDILVKFARSNYRNIRGLPKNFLLKDGTKVVVRNARENEDELLYKMLTDAAERGAGYSMHEFPSLKILRMQYLASGYMATIEEEDTRELLGFIVFRDASLYRCRKGKVADVSAIITAGLRGKGFGSSVQSMIYFVLSLLGYERVLGDTFHTSSQILNLWINEAHSVCGVLPRGAFQKGVGWVDMILCLHGQKFNRPSL